MQPDVPDRLRTLRDLIAALLTGPTGEDVTRAARATAARLDRDLLPRTAGAHTHLVVGIVGPNNAGKSALFNALVGRELSPSRPTGGATRRLLGAAHPDLYAKLAAEPTLAQFPMEVVAPEPGGVHAAALSGGDKSALLLVPLESLPPRLLLVDTPDFDSILVANREASSALLRVADLAIVVVTRHTYQNREVIEFLESWLAHGRPWMLVYNESLGSSVTREHAAKLAEDLASPPIAVFHAPFDLAIAEGTSALAPVAVGDADVAAGGALGEWLFERAQGEDLKRRALDASLLQLRDELLALERALTAERESSAALLNRARAAAVRLGRDVAARAMPMGPFLDAFRAVLDRRPNLLQKGYRTALKRTRLFVERLATRLPLFPSRPEAEDDATVSLAEVEREALRPAWPAYFEELARELVPRKGDAALHPIDPGLAQALSNDLAPGRMEPARERACEALGHDSEMLRAFQEACEELIEEELESRGNEWFFQFAVDVVHLLPAALAGVAIVKTGGLGTDVAVGGAGAVSSLLAEKVSRLLGTRPAQRARRRWTELRGERLAEVLLAAALDVSLSQLVARKEAQGAAVQEIARLRKDIAWTT
ncbi:MAG: hypothetical protein GY711_15720 [bacterium]|nr:hypothetical protein [bacterium]